MRCPYSIIIYLLVFFLPNTVPVLAGDQECVVLLHGLSRTKRSMYKMAQRLGNEGYTVVNHGYPSRHHPIEDLAEAAVPAGLATCRDAGAETIHFVTHSLGGILVRSHLKHHQVPELGRVVMLSPPNHGSEVADRLGDTFVFRLLNGPAGQQLRTGPAGLPDSLGPVDFDLGVITGDRTINFLLSLLIPGPDDGKVSVANAKMDGMDDFLVLHTSHPFIMRNKKAMDQTVHFLQTGKFDNADLP